MEHNVMELKQLLTITFYRVDFQELNEYTNRDFVTFAIISNFL